MTEPTETSVATKRLWLQENGYAVGARGKLSADQNAAYESQVPASQATTQD